LSLITWLREQGAKPFYIDDEALSPITLEEAALLARPAARQPCTVA
jgi:hypothetical protein